MSIDLENITANNFIEEEIIKDLKSGKNTQVITRCPPEPSGYWHIGHCKAWMIDFDIANKFGGYTNLRMDDTNPTKEDGDFAGSYVENLNWLGYTPKNVIYSSEAYFEKMYQIAEKLIQDGKAYVCTLSPEEITRTRGTLTTPGIECEERNRSIDENLQMFRDMRAGKYANGEATLRVKIDMAHPNMNMRDPIIYRVMHAEHYKTGDKWCIYPMYDYAHPLEDVFEGITYSLCTIEFEGHRPLYNWFVENCFDNIANPPRQIEFAPFNLENVLTGKRYLKQLVNTHKVLGWDDPRLYTIVGMRRRGITAQAIHNFIEALGVTKAVTYIPLSQFEYFIRDDLNKTATRGMVVLDPLKVVITNYEGEPETINIENNPNDENAGTHTATFGREIYIEKDDFMLNPVPKYNRLVPNGLVRLKNAYVIKCNNVVLKDNGEIDYLECEYLPNTKSGQDNSGIKVKGTIHFVEKGNATPITIRNFKNVTKMEYLDPKKELEKGTPLEEILEEDSLTETTAMAESFVAKAKAGDKFQFMRKGFYCMDTDSTPDKIIFNSTVSLKDTFNKK